ncbi:MAG TPA: hypothetical protein VHU41_02165, partial [Thermoanaerobaculia bacterium]|nr:hypothetical protein [Thermoanaerobaculia bacterium]
MRRFAFLPAFFTVLIATFAFAVVWKVRSYSTTQTRITSEKEDSSSLRGAPLASPAGWSAGSAGEAAGAPLSTDSQTTATQAATSARLSAERDARYRALLNSPPSGAKGAAVPTNASASHVVTPPKEKPSLIARIVAPIVNAFSGGGAQRPPTPTPVQKPSKNDNSASDTPSKDPKD